VQARYDEDLADGGHLWNVSRLTLVLLLAGV
jgi:hypothetical protein